MDEATVVDVIDSAWARLYEARSLFPRMHPSVAGRGAAYSPPAFYGEAVYEYVVMKTPITSDHVRANNDVAHWLNESFIIRLYAIMQSFEVPKHDCPDVVGYDEYRIVRRLRDKLAHGSSGRVHGQEDREALERMQRVCPRMTPPENYESRFDLSISEVIWPLLLGCRQYSAAICNLEPPTSPPKPSLPVNFRR